MSGGHNRTVMFMVEGGATKINQSHVGAFHATDITVLKMNHRRHDMVNQCSSYISELGDICQSNPIPS